METERDFFIITTKIQQFTVSITLKEIAAPRKESGKQSGKVEFSLSSYESEGRTTTSANNNKRKPNSNKW